MFVLGQNLSVRLMVEGDCRGLECLRPNTWLQSATELTERPAHTELEGLELTHMTRVSQVPAAPPHHSSQALKWEHSDL